MKKILTLLLLLSSLCFGSEFKGYTCISFDKCIKILNELNEKNLVLSYKIVPLEIGSDFLKCRFSKITKNIPESTKILSKLLEEIK